MSKIATLEQIADLKQALDKAQAAYEAEQARLIQAGYKSQQRYQMLKSLKNAVDAANYAYVSAATTYVDAGLRKIIAADRPRKEALARSRSAWKMAKYNAQQAAGK